MFLLQPVVSTMWFILWSFDIRVLAHPGRPAPLRGANSSKQPAVSTHFTCKLTNPESISQTPPALGLSKSRPLSTCTNHPRARCWATGDSPWAPKPAEITQNAAAAAAAAKSLQSCLTLCDPIDGSPPGSPVPGILQARTLEWVAKSA